METKKSEKADLEKLRSIFIQLGFVAVLILVFCAFEWTSEYKAPNTNGATIISYVDPELIDVTYTEEKKQAEPAKPKIFIDFKISKDELDIDEVDIIDDGKLLETALPELYTPAEETVYEEFEVDANASFQGNGHIGFLKYIGEQVKYPRLAAQAGVEGIVMVEFVVNKHGRVSDVKVIKSLDPACDAEAKRVIESSPEWMPALVKGFPVNTRYRFPIRFKLN